MPCHSIKFSYLFRPAYFLGISITHLKGKLQSPHKLTVTGNPPMQSLSACGSKWGQRPEEVADFCDSAKNILKIIVLGLNCNHVHNQKYNLFE